MKTTLLAVNGTLMRGLELNPNLLAVGATFVREDATDACYRLWSIDDRHPAMLRTPGEGARIAVELWDVPLRRPRAGAAERAAGTRDRQGGAAGRHASCSACWASRSCATGKREITAFGGWRAYVAARNRQRRPDAISRERTKGDEAMNSDDGNGEKSASGWRATGTASSACSPTCCST